jgi:integrase
MNTTIGFHSRLAAAMDEFVADKRLQGYDYTDQARTLSYFDHFLAADRRRDDTAELTAATLHCYVTSTAALAANTRQTRLASLREFSRWLQARCPASAVLPPDILPRQPRRVRFFRLAPAQIAELMAAATALVPHPLRGCTTSTAIGLLYCTGLRTAEALSLTPRDLDPEGLTLHVAKGKFGKERLVPLHPSALAALTDYLAVRQRQATGAETAPLFLTAAGTGLTRAQLYGDFRRLCRHCAIWGEPPPRLHDLRHNYAARRLALWRQHGKDVNALLPILATAMGHVNILATQRYLHLDAVALQDAAARFHTHVTNHRESKP